MTPAERAETILWGGRSLPVETRQQIVDAIAAAVAAEQARLLNLLSAYVAGAEAVADAEGHPSCATCCLACRGPGMLEMFEDAVRRKT